jgi:hypothetical protein
MLHVTNGESVIASFRRVRFPGKYLSWADVLHDGPVPQTSTLEQLSDVRARALSDFGSSKYEEMRASFAERDRTIENYRQHEEVVLWFEHDLFDQLQLIQLLDWFAGQDLGKTRLSLIQINSYPGVQPFYGLGQLTGTQLAKLFPLRAKVTQAQLSIGREAWQAFRSDSPEALARLAEHDFPAMPFLRAALRRMLQEYPWTTDGLSRCERQLLKAVAAGAHTRRAIFISSSKDEEVPWGDESVFLRIDRLASGAAPALQQTSDSAYDITEQGRQLLNGQADWVKLQGAVDVWLGGVHLTGPKPEWRWDENAQVLVRA